MQKCALHLLAAAVLMSMPAAAGSITTTFSSNDNFYGNMFDATTKSDTLVVNSLDVNIDAKAVTVDVYIKEGGYAGFETTPADWTLVSATEVTGLGRGNETPVDVTPFVLEHDTEYGIYVTLAPASGAAKMWYTVGANTYANSDVSLSLGDGLGSLFGDVFTGRTWNGTINYTAVPTPEPASFILWGIGLAGLFGRQYKSARR